MTEIERKQQEILQSIEQRIDELKTVKQTLMKCQRDIECKELELELLRKQNDRLMVSLKDCAGELCVKCGKFRNDHLGACDNCKWKDVKQWDID